MSSDHIYTGLPLKHDGTFAPFSPPNPDHSITNKTLTKETPGPSTGYGLLVFIVGVLLAVVAWVANQGN